MAIDLPPAPPSDERFIDEVEHPAAHIGRSGSMSARALIVLVVTALVTAALLNSEGLLRAGESMEPGVTRTLTLAVARPTDGLAQATGLAWPRDRLAQALGREDLSGGEIGDESLTDIVVPPIPATGLAALTNDQPVQGPAVDVEASAARLAPPTRSDPLNVLVAGDSLASYVGIQLDALTSDTELVSVSTAIRNGTGLTNPAFFNWQKAASSDVDKKNPDAVIMIIGGNDGWPMDLRNGNKAWVGGNAWLDEYARRAAAVMKTFQGEGRTVYWSGPPTARDPKWDRIYQSINRAVDAAAEALPGVRYVDLYGSTAVGGGYSTYVRDEGKKVKARQPDGVHWTLDGAVLPARLLVEQLEADSGASLR